MTLTIDRRSLVRGAALGLGALLLPGGGAALAQIAAARGFTHDVASGEPSQDSVLLWTRYVPTSGDSARVSVELSETEDFARIVGGGTAVTGAFRDWTVKHTVAGLQPDRTYFYRFTANGEVSPVGRTRTLPDGRVDAFRMAVFSCANLPFGYFSAYAHAAARDDLQLGVHLGDYLYEYRRGVYPALKEAIEARVLEPANELIQLADYRARYACYRADPDLQRLHNRLPILASPDDHETANDTWEGGAENHNEGEGDWTLRKLAAMQAWREWMPVSDAPFAAYEIGDLATYFRTDTRLLGRSQPLSIEAAFRSGDPAKALAAFRDGPWRDPARSMFGSEQEHWLASELHRSTGRRKKWQVIGNGTIMGRTVAPAAVADWIGPEQPEFVRKRVQAGLLAARAGLPSSMDDWNGYPAARSRLLGAAQDAGADLIMLAGDSHNAWAFELSEGGRRSGVEFDGQSVTSPGYEAYFRGVAPADMARTMVETNPELKWADTSGRGYMTVTLTPAAATAEWLFVESTIGRTDRIARTHRMKTRAGRKTLEVA
ncbi:alkaline phosphatase D family protein [Sphingomonas sp. ID1715]|uniref:alkaline phosphatase D family protein n=1 Tax=Sphingomonas sp. ID1715 TaxID=1656898 RepID=UPI001488B664|nr:alkaline phosphatase D family protein [Sphingomonas sp. ID1715]NNM76121.1 alkaline phosphatase D family protein [Sphingomonas sp. ID1715]